MDMTTLPENIQPDQETSPPILMVSGIICPPVRGAQPAEVRRGMAIRSLEGLETGKVAAVVLSAEHQHATHLLLGRLPEMSGYWLVPVDRIAGVQDQAVQLAIPLQEVDDLPRWQAPLTPGSPGQPEVVIIGAGPAGMMLAYFLVTNGIPVRVLERHPDFKREFRGEGIQPSVVAVLAQLGFLTVLLEKGIAIPAQQARIYLDEQLVVTLGGLVDEDDDFGLIVFQEGFLEFLHQLCSAYPHYRLDMGFTVTEPVIEAGAVTAVLGRRRGGAEERVEGRLFVAASGRNTALRKKAGIDVDVLESTFNIYWMKFDAPPDPALVPDGFRAFLKDDSMFILYRTYDHRLQVAWGKRAWEAQSFRQLDQLKDQLIAEAPQDYRPLVRQQFGEHTERQLLKVACDRMQRWSLPGMLFIGDAAHTMSPVAGQGINLAIRDSIVAANHLVNAHRQGAAWDLPLLQTIEAERRPEVEAMQAFQIRLGYLMLGAPRWLTRLVFHRLMPLLSALGIRQYYVRRVQGGAAAVELQHPVKLDQIPERTQG